MTANAQKREKFKTRWGLKRNFGRLSREERELQARTVHGPSEPRWV